jgi:hypothetical protein
MAVGRIFDPDGRQSRIVAIWRRVGRRDRVLSREVAREVRRD